MCRCSTTLPPTFSLFFSQRSISFRTEARPLPPAALRPRSKASSFPRRRNSQCWSDTVESHDLTVKEIKRQEVRWTTNLASFSCTEKNFSNKMQCVLGISGSGCGAVGLWFAVCAGWLVLCAISLKPFYTAIMKEDVSWHCRLNFPSWTISCKKKPQKKLPVCVFHIKLHACLHPRLVFLTCSNSPAGDLWADSGRETTHRWPQSGQEGAFFSPNHQHHCHSVLHVQVECVTKCHFTSRHQFPTFLSAVHLNSFLTFAPRCTMSPCWSWTSWRRASLDRSLGHWTPSFLSIKVNTH